MPKSSFSLIFFMVFDKRLGILIIVLIAVSIITFTVTRIADTPLYVAIGVYSTKEMIEERKKQMGLNKPMWVQYSNYLTGLLNGNLGSSRRTFAPVIDEIRLDCLLQLNSSLRCSFINAMGNSIRCNGSL